MKMTIGELRHKAYGSNDHKWIERYHLISNMIGQNRIDWDMAVDVHEPLYDGMTEKEWYARQIEAARREPQRAFESPTRLAAPPSAAAAADPKPKTWRDRAIESPLL